MKVGGHTVMVELSFAMEKAGFDIWHRFDARAVARELALPLLDDPERRVGILIGNTRRLWPLLRVARVQDPALAAATDPIDRYTETHVEREREALLGTAFYAHREYGGAYLPFQRIADAAGLAALAPTQLLVHPTFGPWFALRAVILCAGAPPARARVALPCACEASGCRRAFEAARLAEGPEAWRAWLAMRDACPIGREHRYGDDQLAYHYTKDARFLP